MTEAVNVADLKGILDRINRRMDDRDEISADIRDLFTLAKSRGYNTKALRRVIADMRGDPEKRRALEADIDLYRAALGLGGGESMIDPAVVKATELRSQGASFRDIEKATGVKRSVMQRLSRDSVGRDTESAGTTPSLAATAAPQTALVPAEPQSPSNPSDGGDHDRGAVMVSESAAGAGGLPASSDVERTSQATPAAEPVLVTLPDGEKVRPATALPTPGQMAVQRAVMRDTRLGMEAGAVPAVRLTRVTGDYAQSAPDDDIPAFLDRRGRGAA